MVLLKWLRSVLGGVCVCVGRSLSSRNVGMGRFPELQSFWQFASLCFHKGSFQLATVLWTNIKAQGQAAFVLWVL